MNLTIAVLNKQSLNNYFGVKTVTFVDHLERKAANDSEYGPKDKINWQLVTVESNVINEQWSAR